MEPVNIVKPRDNKTALLRSVLNTVIDTSDTADTPETSETSDTPYVSVRHLRQNALPWICMVDGGGS